MEERFIYALFDGEFDDIELDSDIESEERSDDANSQSAWWKTFIEQQWQPDCPDEERSCIGEQHRSLKIGPVMELDPLMEEDDEDEFESSIVDQYESHWNDEEEVIEQFLNSDRNGDGTSCQYIFSVWQVPEADDEDEDNDAAEADATAEEGYSAEARRGDDGDAQSMTVPQHASRDDNESAQSMTVPHTTCKPRRQRDCAEHDCSPTCISWRRR